MQIDRLRTMLDAPAEAETWLRPLGFADMRMGHANLVRLAEAGVPLDLLSTVCEQFAAVAPRLADPDMALNNLERYLLACRSPLAAAALFERDPQAMGPLLLLFSASQSLSDLLCQDPESYDLLRMTAGRAVARDLLVEELVADVRALSSEEEVVAALRRFKRRETLRIAYGDVVKGHSVAKVTRQISYVADAVVEAALDFAMRQASEKQARRNGRGVRPPRFVVLALGKLGGRELNYSSDIDLVMLYQDAANGGQESDVGEYVQRLARSVIHLLAEQTELGFAYRVDMRLRPDGDQGPLAIRTDQALAYYDTRGRTWERQAYVKARAIAGDIELGKEYLEHLKPWIYRRYLSLADITGIKSLKRRIEKRAQDAGVAERNVKTGRGGIRDIEFAIQFLQLLNGGANPRLQTGNTLIAIERLEQAGVLTHQERTILEDNYAFLRKVEHRLQIMFDLQTHELPATDGELAKLARRLDYGPGPPAPLEAFRKDHADRTAVNRKILDHLLHDAFPDDGQTEEEIDLVNDPDPSPEMIQRVLGRYAFRDLAAAYDNLMSLAREGIPFFSTRRCRLFLASIAPSLLASIARTPDPDATLVNLSRVSDSLGGKAALWELFSSNRATLALYVKLCAACPYLAGILTSNPGMIDELMDSLLVEKLPDLARLEASLKELTHGAEDLEPILRSFKHAQHLRVGVRDLVGKDDIRDTQAALADVAEACLTEIAAAETAKLTEKLGQATIGPLPRDEVAERPSWAPDAGRVGQACELVVLALGKLGGREPNYHSDLDLVFLYEAEGSTVPLRGRAGSTSNSHFFSELGQRIIKAANQFGPSGRLYEVDPRLRPTGRSGSLAMPLAEFVRYFRNGDGQLWERLALCKARVIVGSPAAAERAMAAVVDSIYCRPWQPTDAQEILDMRRRLEESASKQNLKRGPGGTMDVEFIVGMLQLKYGGELAELRVPGTLDGLGALEVVGRLDFDDAAFLARSYRFQRSIEARIRLMDAAGRHEFPDEPRERSKLAFLLGYADAEKLAEEVEETRRETRARFQKIFAAAE